MAVVFRVGEHGYSFATRGRGAELRNEVVARTAENQAVILDFDGVTNVSYSFADEFVGKLSSDRPSHLVELANMTDTVGDTVRRAQERRTRPVAC